MDNKIFNSLRKPSLNHNETFSLSRESFPEGFLFGTAALAYQVEGMASKYGRGPSIWDAFVKTPGHIANNDTGEVSIDQYHRYKMLNFDAYRFSISWSRIFPNGTGEINWKGVDYYNRLIDYLLEKVISPHANLYHYDLPLALQEKYLEFCFKTFGDTVKTWMTFNEPRVVSALGFDNGINHPNRCSKQFGNCIDGNSATETYIAAHHLILSHAEVVKTYRIFLDFVWYEPLTRSKADNYAAQRARDINIGWFLHPLVYGKHPRTMQKIIRERLPISQKAHSKLLNEVPNIILSENGMDDLSNLKFPKSLYDINRVNFYKSYLKELKRAMDDGANVTVYFAWSILDNFEWLLGYSSRFGLISQASAYWFKQMLKRKNS
ncbi:hypothetical protein V6Z12_D06G160500 [Gossypium hirsutum]